MKLHKTTLITAFFLVTILNSGCSQINSKSNATPNTSSSSLKKTTPGSGVESAVAALGLAALIGVAFKTAPKEAYR